MPPIVDKVKQRIAAARERRPWLDHVVRTVDHYGAAKGGIQAGAITYFAFISFFPILALAFAVIGFVAKVYPDAQQDLITAIDSVLPDLVGNREGQISLQDIQDAAPSILSVGLVVVLYSGLGWLSSMRDALAVMFVLPKREQPNFFVGKVRDLAALAALGLILIVSVGVSGVVRGLSEQILEWLGLGSGLGWLLGLVAVVLGMAANALLFFALFKVLDDPELPSRALWSGAVLGAVGFEVLKQVSQLLLQSTASSPAFQAFGIALILVVWINYFSRVVMYAAAWAYVHPASRAATKCRGRSSEVSENVDDASPRDVVGAPRSTPRGTNPDTSPGWVAPFVAGSAATLALVAVLHRKQRG